MDEIGTLDFPGWRGKPVIVVMIFITIFKNAADLNTGESENLLVELELVTILEFCLGDQEIFGFSNKRNDCAISMNGAGLNVGNLEVILEVGKFDGANSLPFSERTLMRA
jgi:hypothetical protein